jgi:hypothetical protein
MKNLLMSICYDDIVTFIIWSNSKQFDSVLTVELHSF